MWQELSPHLWRFADTVNVYALRRDDRVVLVDFTAEAYAALPDIGVDGVEAVLLTHVHRDSASDTGLARARVYAPEWETHLLSHPEAHLAHRPIFNRYDVRQDQYVPTRGVPCEPLLDYATLHLLGFELRVWPTPGHTPGSVTLLAEVDGARVAFTGDLLAGPGRVHDLAATQWTYGGGEGLAGSVLSLLSVRDRHPDRLLPTHGEPMRDPASAVERTVEPLRSLLDLRGNNPRLLAWRDDPYEALSPHLLRNRTSLATNYVLRSASGKALLIDFGYDFTFGLPYGTDRHSRRPWLYTLPALERHGVTHVDAAIPTHVHDDHVAGLNLLRRVHGTRILVPEPLVDVLAHPERYDLPCLWHDPIVPDEIVSGRFRWEEYELTLHAFPGHARHAVAISVDVDGQRVLFQGDQYAGDPSATGRFSANYIYANGFEPGDYLRSAELLDRVRPDLLLGGHWAPARLTPEVIGQARDLGARLRDLHLRLQPGAEQASLTPFTQVPRGGLVRVTVVFPEEPRETVVYLPEGWTLVEEVRSGRQASFTVRCGEITARSVLSVGYLGAGGYHRHVAEAIVEPNPSVS